MNAGLKLVSEMLTRAESKDVLQVAYGVSLQMEEETK